MKCRSARSPPPAPISWRGVSVPNSFEQGACLIANLGALGIRRVLPAVVAPWTSVLGLGAAEQRMIVEQGDPAVATMISATLAIDRRAMDEPAAGALIAAFKALIEAPEGLARGGSKGERN